MIKLGTGDVIVTALFLVPVIFFIAPFAILAFLLNKAFG